jgi:hypothetical protein
MANTGWNRLAKCSSVFLATRTRLAHLGQDDVTIVDERDGYFVFLEIPVKAGATAHQFVNFPRDLNSAETSSHDNEAQMPAAPLAVICYLGLFHLAHDVLAQVDGIAHHLETEGMLGHSGGNAEITLRSTGNHDVVVRQSTQGAAAIFEFDFGGSQVDSVHALRPARHSGKHLAQRCGCRIYVYGRSGDVREKWVKYHMVFAIEQDNLALGRSKLPL